MKGVLEPYLDFGGNAKEALDFYAEVFEAPPPNIFLFKDMPEPDQEEASESMSGIQEDWVMNGSVSIGDSTLMASDSSQEGTFGEKGGGQGSNFTLSFSSEDPEVIKKVWDRFVEGGAEVVMPLEKTFWTQQFGMLKDQFGVQWMIQEYVAQPEYPTI